jgi:hypothetical protein
MALSYPLVIAKIALEIVGLIKDNPAEVVDLPISIS